jgi:hypothetical protein
MSSEGYARLEIMDDCDRGRHALQPRYDVVKAGDLFKKVYVCDICPRCGHTVTRQMSMQEQLDAGLISIDEARAAFTPAVMASAELIPESGDGVRPSGCTGKNTWND